MHFPPKFLKIVATRGEIFSLKFTKYRLAAGLRPDPLGSYSAPPDPLAAIRGPRLGALVVTHAMLRRLTSWRCIIIIIITSKGRGREGRGREGREGKGGGKEGREGCPPL